MKIIALPYLCSGTTFPPRTDLRWPGQCVLLCECLLGWSFVVDYTVGCTVLYQQGQVTKLYTDRGLFLIIIASKHMGHRKRDETGIFFIIIGDIYYILCTHPFIIYIMQYFSPSHNLYICLSLWVGISQTSNNHNWYRALIICGQFLQTFF